MKKESLEEKREMISEAAVKIFARKGYHGSRIADIAHEAGISYGLVYHYFKSKEEIVTYLFRSKWELFSSVIESVLRDDTDFKAKFRTITSFLVESYKINPELVEALVMELTRNSRFIKGKNLRLLERSLYGIEMIISDAQKKGEIKASIDPKAASYCYLGSVEAVLTGFVFKTFSSSEGLFEKVQDTILSIFCDGLRVLPAEDSHYGKGNKSLGSRPPLA